MPVKAGLGQTPIDRSAAVTFEIEQHMIPPNVLEHVHIIVLRTVLVKGPFPVSAG